MRHILYISEMIGGLGGGMFLQLKLRLRLNLYEEIRQYMEGGYVFGIETEIEIESGDEIKKRYPDTQGSASFYLISTISC